MKGLLYKDWSLIAGGYRTNFILLLLCYSLFTITFRVTFLAYAMVFVLGMYASSTIALDENSHWDAYAHTLPVTPGQLVSSKYLLTLLLTFASLPLGYMMIALLPTPKPSPLETSMGLAAAVAVTLLYLSFVIPLSYHFGATKARSWVSLSILIVALGPVAVFMVLPDTVTQHFQNALHTLDLTVTSSCSELAFTLLVIAGLVLFSLAVFGISWAVSVRIYTRKTY